VARKPGWYHDPDGLPGVHRWWDGQTWTVDVTTDPKTAQPPDFPSATQPVTVPPDEPSVDVG
jgi:hypothetical protein